MTEKILYDSPEAAHKVTDKVITGWVSKGGNFFGNGKNAENMARYDGSTHTTCDCGEEREKTSYCRNCHEKTQTTKFDAMKTREWDFKEPICTFDSDEYFFEAEELTDYIEEHGIATNKLRLVFCVREKLKEFDFSEHNHQLCEGDDHYPEIDKKVVELNELIRNTKSETWYPSNVAAIVDFEKLGEV